MKALSRASRESSEIRTGAFVAAEGRPGRQRGDEHAHGTAETVGRNAREVGAGVPNEEGRRDAGLGRSCPSALV